MEEFYKNIDILLCPEKDIKIFKCSENNLLQFLHILKRAHYTEFNAIL